MATTGLHLSKRAQRVLRELLGHGADLDRPEIVAQASETALRRTMGCGLVTLREIRLWLSDRGLNLASSDDAAHPGRIAAGEKLRLH
jgi:hypothetical protein